MTTRPDTCPRCRSNNPLWHHDGCIVNSVKNGRRYVDSHPWHSTSPEAEGERLWNPRFDHLDPPVFVSSNIEADSAPEPAAGLPSAIDLQLVRLRYNRNEDAGWGAQQAERQWILALSARVTALEAQPCPHYSQDDPVLHELAATRTRAEALAGALRKAIEALFETEGRNSYLAASLEEVAATWDEYKGAE